MTDHDSIQCTSIEHFFSDLADPRANRNLRHTLLDVVTIAICGIICGCEYWTEVEEFGEEKEEWFRSFLELPNGIPSHDTFNDFFRHLDANEFETAFIEWTKHIAQITKGEVVAVDGKTLRGSHDRSLDKQAIHMVSAYAASNRLVLGQVKTEDKSNEITAIPELLKILDIKGAIVTIDAMGCQRDIAATIRAEGADYVLAVKENHPNLHEGIQLYFDDNELTSQASTYSSDWEGDHGRIEHRSCTATDDVDWLYQKSQWKGLRSIACIESTVIIGDMTTREKRYYITSLPPDAKSIQQAIRTHWQIENSVHWLLDVSFLEDACRVRKDHGPENFSVLRRIALNGLKRESSCKLGIKSKQKKAGWSTRYLAKVLECLAN